MLMQLTQVLYKICYKGIFRCQAWIRPKYLGLGGVFQRICALSCYSKFVLGYAMCIPSTSTPVDPCLILVDVWLDMKALTHYETLPHYLIFLGTEEPSKKIWMRYSRESTTQRTYDR